MPLFATRTTEEWQLTQVLDEIDRLRESSITASSASTVPLTLSDVRAMLDGLLASPHGRLDLRSGAVVVTSLTPVRNLPARVVCIVGLEEGTLRAAGVDGDDLLAVRPCVGERDPRLDGRHLLLDALLAAGEQLIITFDGNDLTTNRELPLPVHLGELLEVVGRTTATKPSELVRRHPRRAHDERNFVAAADEPFSFDSCMLAGALARRTRREDAVIIADVLEPALVGVVDIAGLTDACTRPARTYLKDRLDVRLPRTPENLDPSIPIAASPLDTHGLGDDLLEHHRELADDAAAVWRATTRLRGGLPPRELANAALDAVEAEVAEILGALPDLHEQFRAATISRSVDVVLEPPAWLPDRSPIAVRDTIDRVAGDTVVRVEFTRPKARTRIAAALSLAALIVSEPDRAWNAVVAMRAQGSSSPRPVVVRLLPLVPKGGEAEARAFLAMALDLRLRALREPLPIFEVSRDLFFTGAIEDRDLEQNMWEPANAFLWGDRSVDDLLAIAPIHSDPVIDATPYGSAVPSRMAGFATTIWQSYKDFVYEADV